MPSDGVCPVCAGPAKVERNGDWQCNDWVQIGPAAYQRFCPAYGVTLDGVLVPMARPWRPEETKAPITDDETLVDEMGEAA